jgi:CRP-like cAMP-binding protein
MAAEATTKDPKSLLKNLVPLNALSDEHLGQLLRQITVQRAKKGDFLFREGESERQHVYLLEGTITLVAGKREVDSIQSGTKTARFPLAHQWPRKVSARVKTEAHFVRIESRIINDFLAKSKSHASYRVNESLEGDVSDGDWMSQVLRARVLQQLPPANIQGVLRRMEEVKAPAGEVVIRQGDQGDFFYVIVRGTCTVAHQNAKGSQKVAMLGPGDSFGEDALVSGGTRGSTIAMASDGLLMRLGKKDFLELICKPLLRRIKIDDAKELVEQGAIWVDIRTQQDYATAHQPDALSCPLATLRTSCEAYDQGKTYVVYGDPSADSGIGTFLLVERGFDALALDDGGKGIDLANTQKARPAANKAPKGGEKPVPPGRVQELEQQLKEIRAQYQQALVEHTEELRKLKKQLEVATIERNRLQQDLDDAQEIIQEASAQESVQNWEQMRIQTQLKNLEEELAKQRELNRVLQEQG